MPKEPLKRSLAEAQEILRDLEAYDNPNAAVDAERRHTLPFSHSGKEI